MAKIIGAAALGLLLTTGCVSQEKYNALKLERDSLAEQNGKLQSDVNGARAEADAFKNQLQQIMANGGNLQALVTNLQQQNAQLQAQYDELNRQYITAMNRPSTNGNFLPEPLNNALTQFAAQNPDLVDFDSARGVVKFKSDVTFSSGSADVTPKAKEALGRFSSILNSSAANGYELMVAGHTDNQRVSNPATVRAGHLDNWYLSSHRAITVGSELRKDNVNPQRIAVVGYADQRPIASNSSETGKAQNRRVEVLILPTTVRSAPVDVASTPTKSTPHNPTRTFNKDSTASTPTGPILNK